MIAILCMALAVVIGVLVSIQPAMNNILARAVSDPFFTAAVSGFMTLLAALALLLVTERGQISRANLATVPWWVYLAGVFGTGFVAGSIVMVPIIGALLFFVCAVGGQMLGATLADHFGAFGLPVRPISVQRIAGLALVLFGAILVQRG